MIKYAEFCTGIGGFRLGVEQSKLDAQLVYSNEINDNCEKTYKLNFGSGFNSKDLLAINPEELPDFDMICAGFPCQPFSQAGKCKGFDDPRGSIFFKLLAIIKVKQPKILFFENVPNLKNHDSGNTFKVITKSLEKEGYSVFYQILDSSNFGVPQSRPRIYIIGFRNDSYGLVLFDMTKQLTSKTAFRNFLELGDYSIPISAKWQEYIDLYTNHKKKEDISFPLPKTRVKLERISKNCNLDDCVLQIRSSGIRAYSLDEPFPTFAVSVSGGGAMIPVLTKERRHLNLTEMKRLMGFPEWFLFDNVSRTEAIKQLANAVCPPVITSICNDICNSISRLG